MRVLLRQVIPSTGSCVCRGLVAVALLAGSSGCWQVTARPADGALLALASDPAAAGRVVERETVGYLFWGLLPLRAADLQAATRARQPRIWRDVRIEIRDEWPGVAFTWLTLGVYSQRTLVVIAR